MNDLTCWSVPKGALRKTILLKVFLDLDFTLRRIILLQVFLDLDFTLMEMNPFTLDSEGKPFPLDMRGELDDTAAFKSGKKCAPSDPADQGMCMDACLTE